MHGPLLNLLSTLASLSKWFLTVADRADKASSLTLRRCMADQDSSST